MNKNTSERVMIEELEGRELFSMSMTPSIPIPPPGPTASRIVVVQGESDPKPTASVVIQIIAVLIGL